MNDVRNYWLTAIAGHQGNAPNNTSREDPTGAEGAGGTQGPAPRKPAAQHSNNQRHTATRSVL